MSVLCKTLKTYAQENFSVFQTSSNLLPQSYSLLDTKPAFVNTLDEVRNSREKYETMTSEVERLQSHLSS